MPLFANTVHFEGSKGSGFGFELLGSDYKFKGSDFGIYNFGIFRFWFWYLQFRNL